ncbi:MAG: hypothetical protein IPN44_14160 [Flavobacteriales bacterium]|nr:hypothetical protein [Flavobacteriales bacterium]
MEAERGELHGCLWMHCASAGEFEQGRPVLEAIKKERPDLPVLLTFFSPSGFEARKAFPLATHVEYLPPDTRVNAQRLQELLRPKVAIFVKYEFWYHHLQALRENGTPTFLVSALFRNNQPFFRWYGGTWRRMLQGFKQIYTQDQASMDLLAGLGLRNVSVGGDTRFDRVARIIQDDGQLPLAEAFAGEAPSLVCGSTWPEDERLLGEALKGMGKAAPKCFVVPHELQEAQLEATEKRFPKPLGALERIGERGSRQHRRHLGSRETRHATRGPHGPLGPSLPLRKPGVCGWRLHGRYPQCIGGRGMGSSRDLRTEIPQIPGGSRTDRQRCRCRREGCCRIKKCFRELAGRSRSAANGGGGS